MQIVAHALLLGVHVAEVVGIGGYLNGYVFDNFETVSFKTDTFYRIVCHKTHLTYAEQVQYLSTHALVAFVGIMTQMYVCLYSIKALFL